MSKKISKIKTNIRQYADFKGFSRREFNILIEASESFLKSDGGFNVDFLPIIRQKCPDLNINWLLFNEGEMIIKNLYQENNIINTVEEPNTYSYKDKYIQILEENRILQTKVINLLEINSSLKKSDTQILDKS
ncbi:hypothetical protein [Algibacter sp. PT7-4]|uniref:hypothetical protein n=1 Tax=Algibacter ulvanivorans TaxID=3400999 RepID=UPI003AAD22F3